MIFLYILCILTFSHRELKAEVARLRSLNGLCEKSLGLTPRKFIDLDSASDSSEEIVNKQREIDELKVQIKKMQEESNATQK